MTISYFLVYAALGAVGFAFGWKSSGWYMEVKKLRAQNKAIQSELLESNQENFEMKTQLGLTPHRRLMLLLSEPDLEKTVSDAEFRKERSDANKAPYVGGGGGMPLLIIAAAAAAVAASNSKKKKESPTATLRKDELVRDMASMKARLKDKASK